MGVRPLVLLVDDEPRILDTYVDELADVFNEVGEPKYEIKAISDTDDAWEYLETSGISEVSILVLDIMMPPGERFQLFDTRQGLRTGERFFDQLRALAPTLPVIILTNVSDPRVRQYFEKDPLCWFMTKREASPLRLVEHIGRVLNVA